MLIPLGPCRMCSKSRVGTATGVGSVPSPYTMAGTLPSRRIFRAADFPTARFASATSVTSCAISTNLQNAEPAEVSGQSARSPQRPGG